MCSTAGAAELRPVLQAAARAHVRAPHMWQQPVVGVVLGWPRGPCPFDMPPKLLSLPSPTPSGCPAPPAACSPTRTPSRCPS